MNRTIHAAAAEQRGVRGIHDRIDLELRDVAAVEFELRFHWVTRFLFSLSRAKTRDLWSSRDKEPYDETRAAAVMRSRLWLSSSGGTDDPASTRGIN